MRIDSVIQTMMVIVLIIGAVSIIVTVKFIIG